MEKPKVAVEKPKVVMEKPKVAMEKPKVVEEKPKVAEEKPKGAVEKLKVVGEKPKVEKVPVEIVRVLPSEQQVGVAARAEDCQVTPSIVTPVTASTPPARPEPRREVDIKTVNISHEASQDPKPISKVVEPKAE